MFDYAKCVVGRSHKSAADAILANVGNGVIMRRYPELINGACLGQVAGHVSLSFKGDLYRYALADALVNADFATTNPIDFSNKLPLAPFPASTEAEFATALAKVKSKQERAKMQDSFAKRSAYSWLSDFGECVVRQNPAASRLWLLTKPNGSEEMSRIDVLRPAFVACLDKGTLHFGKVILRGAVAINYYRLAMATPQPKLPSQPGSVTPPTPGRTQ
jgi:hypothetical protein